MVIIKKDNMDNEKSAIASWYADKHIFITGATGFMGKVLVEKLLRSCPDIKAIYLLIRPKKGLTPQMRKEQYFKCVGFGKADHAETKRILLTEYKDYNIEISDEGY